MTILTLMYPVVCNSSLNLLNCQVHTPILMTA